MDANDRMPKTFLEFLTDSLGPGLHKIEGILKKEDKPLHLPQLLDAYVQRVLVGELLADGLWGCTKCDWAGDRASTVYDHAAHAHHAKLSEETSLAGKQAAMTLVVKGGEKVPKCTKCGYTGKSADEAASFYARHLRECALKFRDTKATVCKIDNCGYATAGADEFVEHLDEAHQASELVEQIYKPADVAARLKKSKHLKEELAPLHEWFHASEKPSDEWLKRLADGLKKDGRFGEVPDGWTLASKVPPPAPPPDAKGTKKTVRTTKTAKTSKTEKTVEPKVNLAEIQVGTVPEHGPGFLTWEREWKVSHYVLASTILVVDRFDREGTKNGDMLARLHDRFEQVEKVTRYGVVKETKNRGRIGARFDMITETDSRGPCLHARPAVEHLAAIAKIWHDKVDNLMGEVALLAQNLVSETHQSSGLSEAQWDYMKIFSYLPAIEGGWVEPTAWLEAINKHLHKKQEEELPNLGSTLVQHFLVPFGLMEVSKKKPATYRLTPFADLCLTQ